jgi:uncharacterized MAPEG superfamily protein
VIFEATHWLGNMTPELSFLVWSGVLMFVQMIVALIGAQLQVGLLPLVQNRENLPTMTGWAGRARRAHLNMLENIVLFAILVLVAQAAGKHNAMTVLGSEIFFWSRVAYAVIYVAGIPWLRTLAWTASVVGLIIIFREIMY